MKFSTEFSRSVLRQVEVGYGLHSGLTAFGRDGFIGQDIYLGKPTVARVEAVSKVVAEVLTTPFDTHVAPPPLSLPLPLPGDRRGAGREDTQVLSRNVTSVLYGD